MRGGDHAEGRGSTRRSVRERETPLRKEGLKTKTMQSRMGGTGGLKEERAGEKLLRENIKKHPRKAGRGKNHNTLLQ